MGTRRGGTIVRILRNLARRNRGWVCSLVIRGEEPMQMCAIGNPARRNHCEDTREPGAAEPRTEVGCVKNDFEMQMCANGNPARRNHCVDTREPGATEPRTEVGCVKNDFEMQLCANGNPARRNHCEDTREPGAAEPRLAHGVTLGDPDILYWWRRWYNVSDFVDNQDEQYTLEAFGAKELARMKPQAEL
ncbi:hypothetical protein RHMOL_Rhmol04G0204700 [Rhododendron molle]|uniref:Uncharacterized protein n=1 Tax=Rhododendron molle TaxID=49168 RepID=A0ACC0P3S4_RHOML|nr:hypothetical protein RHMOL_Rhmol04G0204700 [Rhododendron molle]